VNGHPVRGVFPLPVWIGVIEALLKK
jgi:hypothetical protein